MSEEKANSALVEILYRPHDGGYIAYEDNGSNYVCWASTSWSAVGLYLVTYRLDLIRQVQPEEGRDTEGYLK